ncbi:ABC transporter F family member 4-like isoform X5 [Chenopodium quinoa]|uniref:ABC transporter F family member 4-like isoform X5 n=1 Tax=Chenopodium quinoa TaxID=63459 RepID=UPI000B786E7D|nr:ABC transporter F family member 4-like isoform X5 [Chenopodium quinoa]
MSKSRPPETNQTISEQSENIPATNATTKSVSATHNTTDKESRDESKQEEVQPKVQSNPVKNSLGQKKPKDDSRITTLKDKMQEIHLDIERNPKKYKESTIRIMRNLKRMEKASKEIRKGEAKKKEKGPIEEKTVEKEGQEGKKGTEKEKSPKDKTVEDVFPKTTNVEEGQEGKKEPEKEKIPKEKTVEDESTKTTDPKAQIAPDFVQIEDETYLLDQDDDKVSTKLSEETAPSSQKSDQSTKMKTRYKMVARKNKNKSLVVVPSGRITRSQDVLLDESEKGSLKKDVEPAKETAKIGQKRRMSTRNFPIQKEADAPPPAPTPIKKMAGAPAEYPPDQGKKGGKKKTLEEVKKTSKVAGKRKADVSPAKRNAGKRKKIQEVPSDEPSQDPTDESSTDSDDDSEESVYRAEEEPVSEDDYEVEEEEEEDEVKPRKKQAKKGNSVKAKVEKEEQKMVLYDEGKIEGRRKKKMKTEMVQAIETDEVEEIQEDEFEEEKSSKRGGHVKFIAWIKKMTPTQKQQVVDIGLGSLLDISLPQLDQKFCNWLLGSFEENSQCFELPKNEKIEIEVEDVRVVYGLPTGEIPIVEPKSDKISEEYAEFLKKWRKSWSGKTPSVSQIVNGYINDKFTNNRPPSEHFITNFLAVAVNCLMKCVSNNQCHFKFLYSMMDKENIKNLNWCQFVYDSLIKCHVDWRKQQGKGFYKGPLQFLMLFYFDRVQRLDKRPPRTIPIISAWNRDMVLERLKIELELGFGRGKILPRIAAEVEESPKVFMDDFVSLVKTTCSNLSKLSSKLVKAKDIFPGNDLVKKVDEVLGKVVAREPSILSQDEEFFGSEDFLNALAQAEKNLMQGSEKQTTEKQMTGKKLTKKGKEKEQEYDIRKAFSLGLTPPSPAIGKF